MIPVMVVDDEVEICRLMSDILSRRGYEPRAFQDGEAALEHMRRERPPIAILDIKMPRINGVELAQELRKANPDVSIVMITGYARDELVNEALRLNVEACLAKPVRPTTIMDMLAVVESTQKFARARTAPRPVRRTSVASVWAGCMA
jgi:two-component system, NtrC family, response regulator HydG